MRTLIIFVAILQCAWVCSAQNRSLVIQNPSFEQAAKNKISYWSWWSRTQHGTATQTSKLSHHGQYSVCIQHEGPRDWGFSSSTMIKAQPNDAFKISAWVKIQTGHLEIGAVAMSQGKVIAWDIGSTRMKASNDWQKIEAIAEAPEDTDTIYLRFIGDQSVFAWVDDVKIEPYRFLENNTPKPKLNGYAQERGQENMGRGLIACYLDQERVYLSWRMLPRDNTKTSFDVFRKIGGEAYLKVNAQPITKTTDFIDQHVPKHQNLSYRIKACDSERADALSMPIALTPNEVNKAYISLQLKNRPKFSHVSMADLDGDGRYDYIIKKPGGNIDPYHKYWKKSPHKLSLEAYNADGTFMWNTSLGWSIEAGIWYSPYLAYDFNGDGKAEIALKTGQGDPRDESGRVQSGPEFLTILQGETGKVMTQTDWPKRSAFENTGAPYNYASRNQLGVAYLDGKTPHLILERGTYNIILVEAFELQGEKLHQRWTWDNRKQSRRYYGQGAHWMHGADVDQDGRDEVIIGSAVIDDNGDSLWSVGLGHPDHSYVGDLDPSHPGLEIYYGIETPQRKGNGMCMVAAATGQILWGYKGPTYHVHNYGMCSDIDARFPGAECYSADSDHAKNPAWAQLNTSQGQLIHDHLSWSFGARTVYWNEDLQREVIWKRTIMDFDSNRQHEPFIEGHIVAIADILGDWREEIITSTSGELRIYTTTIPAKDRRPCLMTDPIYRNNVAHSSTGYFQVPMLSYDLATDAQSKTLKSQE